MSVVSRFRRFPKWHCSVLRAAAVYNVLWGASCILFPMQLLTFFNMDPLPNYPELWQCLGMITAVYGPGYWIASRDPVRHWPIVLVGLIGKILDPVGYTYSLMNERISGAMGLAILTNDVIWWIPFAMILWNAKKQQAVETRGISPDEPHGIRSRPSPQQRHKPGTRVVWSSISGTLREHS